MKRIFQIALSSLLFFSLSVSAQKKAVFVIVDGIPPDVLESMNTPNINAIAKQGFYLRAHVGGDSGRYNQTPTISANGYNSLLTGTWVNKHNVWDNDIADPNYHYKTLFRVLKDEYPAKKIAVFSSWQDNRTKLVGESLPQTNNIKLDYAADGFELDTIHFPHDKERDFMHRIDDTVVNAAVKSIRTQAPDLSWVYLEYSDDMGHMYGDSKEQRKAIDYVDDFMGRLWKAIEYRKQNFKEDWMIVITTDHGRDAMTGHNHGGQSQRERSTWIVANKKPNEYGRYDELSIVDIYPSLANFLQVAIPNETKRELDGVPFYGPVSIAQPKLNFIQNKIDVSWQNFDTSGNVKIWVTNTNNFKTGGTDDYKLAATVPASQRHAAIDVSAMPSSFYKVVLEGKNNTVNRWLLVDQNKK